jgi:hypothetical protein
VRQRPNHVLLPNQRGEGLGAPLAGKDLITHATTGAP